jgi:hypothetical protein
LIFFVPLHCTFEFRNRPLLGFAEGGFEGAFLFCIQFFIFLNCRTRFGRKATGVSMKALDF